jgi:hypothetical protein
MPHCSAQYGQCVATVCSAIETRRARGTPRPWSALEAISGLKFMHRFDESLLQADDLVGGCLVTNKIVEKGRMGSGKLAV